MLPCTVLHIAQSSLIATTVRYGLFYLFENLLAVRVILEFVIRFGTHGGDRHGRAGLCSLLGPLQHAWRSPPAPEHQGGWDNRPKGEVHDVISPYTLLVHLSNLRGLPQLSNLSCSVLRLNEIYALTTISYKAATMAKYYRGNLIAKSTAAASASWECNLSIGYSTVRQRIAPMPTRESCWGPSSRIAWW